VGTTPTPVHGEQPRGGRRGRTTTPAGPRKRR
jgi:hypothetical protein